MTTPCQGNRGLRPPQYFYLSGALLLFLGQVETGTLSRSYLGLPFLALFYYLARREKQRFAQRGTTIFPGQQASILVTDGLFRYSRNPMYLAMVLGLLSLWPLTGGYLPLLVVFGFAALLQERFIKPEERALHEQFGEDYAEYQRQVQRWL